MGGSHSKINLLMWSRSKAYGDVSVPGLLNGTERRKESSDCHPPPWLLQAVKMHKLNVVFYTRIIPEYFFGKTLSLP